MGWRDIRSGPYRYAWSGRNGDDQLPKSSEKVQKNQQKGSDWLISAAVSVGWWLVCGEGEDKIEHLPLRGSALQSMSYSEQI